MTVDDAPTLVALDAPQPPALAAIPAPKDSAPPRKSRSGTSGAERRRRAAAGTATPKRDSAPRAPKEPPLAQQISDALETVGMLVGTFVDPYDGAVLTHNAKRAGAALADVAERRPGFAKLLRGLLATGNNLEGVTLLAGIALPILCHHGILPGKYVVVATVLGTAPPQPSNGDSDALREALRAMTDTGAAAAQQGAA